MPIRERIITTEIITNGIRLVDVKNKCEGLLLSSLMSVMVIVNQVRLF